MKAKSITALLHLLVWGGILLVPFLLTPPEIQPSMPPPAFPRSPSPNYPALVAVATLFISFYYLNYYKLIPVLYLKKRTATYILSIIGLFFIIRLLSFLIFNSFTNHQDRASEMGNPLVMLSPLLFTIVLFVSLGMRLTSEWKRAEEEMIKIEKEKLNVELSYLKAQVNPHFLFNSLNSIYSLAIIQSNKTADAIMKLSKLMRYVIYEANAPMVLLEMELSYIQSFIELHQLRLTENNHIEFQIIGDPNKLMIAPLILIPFVENAIKHGTSTIEQTLIRIKVSLLKSDLYFSVVNTKVNVISKNKEPGGIGIENTRKRLEMIYKKNQKFSIIENDDSFKVDLKIVLS